MCCIGRVRSAWSGGSRTARPRTKLTLDGSILGIRTRSDAQTGRICYPPSEFYFSEPNSTCKRNQSCFPNSTGSRNSIAAAIWVDNHSRNPAFIVQTSSAQMYSCLVSVALRSAIENSNCKNCRWFCFQCVSASIPNLCASKPQNFPQNYQCTVVVLCKVFMPSDCCLWSDSIQICQNQIVSKVWISFRK